jgi:hypothetical protein
LNNRGDYSSRSIEQPFSRTSAVESERRKEVKMPKDSKDTYVPRNERKDQGKETMQGETSTLSPNPLTGAGEKQVSKNPEQTIDEVSEQIAKGEGTDDENE